MILTDRWIFVHNPKTGGKSVTTALGGRKDMPVARHTPLWAVKRKGRFAFGFVRNPWARMVSFYRYQCRRGRASVESGFRHWLMDCDDWIVGESPRLTPIQRRSQMWWLDGCDFIGRTEAMRRDFRRAMEMIRVGTTLPHVNRTEGRPWREEYDAASIAFVATHFAPEIERFGYEFD